jgi:hypothetical protein
MNGKRKVNVKGHYVERDGKRFWRSKHKREIDKPKLSENKKQEIKEEKAESLIDPNQIEIWAGEIDWDYFNQIIEPNLPKGSNTFYRFSEGEMELEDRSRDLMDKTITEDGDVYYGTLQEYDGVNAIEGFYFLPDFILDNDYGYTHLIVFYGKPLGENPQEDGILVKPKEIISQIPLPITQDSYEEHYNNSQRAKRIIEEKIKKELERISEEKDE